MKKIDQESINTLRFLSIDEVQAANSGHPGLPLGTAPAYVYDLGSFHEGEPQGSVLVRPRFVLFFRQAMVLPCNMPCFIWLDTRSPLMI